MAAGRPKSIIRCDMARFRLNAHIMPNMALRLGIEQKATLSPRLFYGIRLLQLARGELEAELRDALEENPALEELAAPHDPSTPPTDDPRGSGSDPSAERWERYLDRRAADWQPRGDARGVDGAAFDRVATLVASESLSEHLLGQIRMDRLSTTEEAIASRIVANLDERGYLQIPVTDIAFDCGEELETVERMLHRMQRLDPVGIAARDLRECLLVQLEDRGLEASLAAQVVRDHFGLLERQRFGEIAESVGESVDAVRSVVATLRGLDPEPALGFEAGPIEAVKPDLTVYEDAGEFRIALNDDGLPQLRISPYYQALRRDRDARTRHYLSERLQAAKFVLGCIEQRRTTLLAVATSIMRFQQEFLRCGRSHVRPLVLQDVAEDVGRDPSTVSRAVAHKFVQTPHGILPLKFFFQTGVGDASSGRVASVVLQDRIRDLVAAEDPRRPLSDEQIVTHFASRGVEVARRTVAKYRQVLRIPSSDKRRR